MEVPPADQYASVSAMPEADRFELLPRLMLDAYGSLEDLARWGDPNLRERRDLSRQQATQYALDALTLASKFRTHPKDATAIYTANMTLAALALREGDEKQAVAFFLNASKAPVSEELAYSNSVVSARYRRLAADLLKRGKRDAVLTFLARMSETSLARRAEMREAGDAIRRGETPSL